MKKINIGIDFSKTPMGRFKSDGNSSGEKFRDDVLIPALNANDSVEVIIDQAEGYGSSFLEESFGGLVRNGFSLEDLQKKLVVKWLKKRHFQIYITAIWHYIIEEDSKQKTKKKEPQSA